MDLIVFQPILDSDVAETGPVKIPVPIPCIVGNKGQHGQPTEAREYLRRTIVADADIDHALHAYTTLWGKILASKPWNDGRAPMLLGWRIGERRVWVRCLRFETIMLNFVSAAVALKACRCARPLCVLANERNIGLHLPNPNTSEFARHTGAANPWIRQMQQHTNRQRRLLRWWRAKGGCGPTWTAALRRSAMSSQRGLASS